MIKNYLTIPLKRELFKRKSNVPGILNQYERKYRDTEKTGYFRRFIFSHAGTAINADRETTME